MIKGKYVALVRAPDGPPLKAIVDRLVHALNGERLSPVFVSDRVAILRDDALPARSVDGGPGILLGNIFSLSDSCSTGPAELEAAVQSDISERKRATLPASLWGDYLLFIDDSRDEPVQVLRSAFGTLPCYHGSTGGITVLASHVDLLFGIGLIRPRIDWAALANHLSCINLRGAETCLEGVSELLPGQRLDLGVTTTQCEIWSPWDHANTASMVQDAEQVTAALRQTITASVAAVSQTASHVVLGLSGGLDSSIVAAALAECGQPFTCLTLVTDDPSGDERDYARLVANALGVRLEEANECVEAVDIERSDAALLPRPVARAFAQSGDQHNQALARALGADGFMNGGGGDNVFCFVESARPIADRLLFEGFGAGALRTASDMSDLTDSSLWTALRKGIRRAWFQDQEYRWKTDTNLLAADVAAAIGPFRSHPWTSPPKGEYPGKAQHVAWLLGIQNHIEGYGRERVHSTMWPLLTQPVAELCLRIPTWMWFDKGQNRVIARRAFADILPERILNRRSKGTPDSFVVQVFERNRDRIRTFLADGLLARHGIIDRDAVIAACRDQGLTKGVGYWRIMGLVDAEAWARSWMTRAATIAVTDHG